MILTLWRQQWTCNPRVAEVQVIIVSVGITARAVLMREAPSGCETIKKRLLDINVRADVEFREGYLQDGNFLHYELKGLPLRIEYGPKDGQECGAAVRRDNGAK